MSDPNSIYMNGLCYQCDRDPEQQEPIIQDFVIANFQSGNKVEWYNTSTNTWSILTNVDSSNNLLWSSYDLTPITTG